MTSRLPLSPEEPPRCACVRPLLIAIDDRRDAEFRSQSSFSCFVLCAEKRTDLIAAERFDRSTSGRGAQTRCQLRHTAEGKRHGGCTYGPPTFPAHKFQLWFRIPAAAPWVGYDQEPTTHAVRGIATSDIHCPATPPVTSKYCVHLYNTIVT